MLALPILVRSSGLKSGKHTLKLILVVRRNLGTDYHTMAASTGAIYSAMRGETQLKARMTTRMANNFIKRHS